MSVCSLSLVRMLCSWMSILLQVMFLLLGLFGRDDVSLAWLVWSGAAEVALADAFRFSGGPLSLLGGLVLGRGSGLHRVVRLGGHKVL